MNALTSAGARWRMRKARTRLQEAALVLRPFLRDEDADLDDRYVVGSIVEELDDLVDRLAGLGEL